jgi:8-amino-3,8-dideoxy-alpha-D-manno-octulosonate transaminase
MNKEGSSRITEANLPIRTEPLPLEFPGLHYLDDQEIEAVVRVLKRRSPFRYYGIDSPGEVSAFESEFAEFLGVAHALAVNSGTAALHVALSALGVGPGQEVIVPAYMWASVAAAVINLGAIPVLADIDDTFCVDPENVRKHLTPRTSGIIAVHMSGAPADVPVLLPIARESGLFLLEDCAQFAGGSIGGKKAGTFGDMGIFSFQINKNMTSGEGGCVVTNDARLYKRAFACHDTGYVRDEKGREVFSELDLCLWGRGCRLDELRGAILRVQLSKLPRIVAKMRSSKYRIRQALESLPQIKLRRIVDTDGDTGCFLISTYPDAETARKVSHALRAEGIVTWPQGVSNVVMTDWGLHIYYNLVSLVHCTSSDKMGFPWNLQENKQSEKTYNRGTCPMADSLFERSVLLAIPSCLSEQDENDIIHAFEKVVGVSK